MDSLEGKTAVITGGASGIGLELAKQFGARGMKLVVADIEEPVLDAATAELTARGHEVLPFVLDVRHHDEIQALEAVTIERFGNVHVLCNNAGVGAGGPVADPANLEAWRWTIDIDLWGVIYGCKVFLPAMLAHGEPCHIVNTASMAGLGSAPFMGAYNIAKYGVVALSETLAKEMQLAQTKVGVSVLCPAFVATGIADGDRNMPADVREQLPPPLAVDSPMAQFIKDLVANGISTEIVGEAVVHAILHDEFWILTHDETKPGVIQRAQEIVDGVNPSANFGMA